MKTKFGTVLLLCWIFIAACERTSVNSESAAIKEKTAKILKSKDAEAQNPGKDGIKDLTHSNCKSNDLDADLQESIRFRVIERKTLQVDHYNVEMSCCDEILVERKNTPEGMKISEAEKNPGDCVCYYDIHFQVSPVAANKKPLTLYTPLRVLVFNLDLRPGLDTIIDLSN